MNACATYAAICVHPPDVMVPHAVRDGHALLSAQAECPECQQDMLMLRQTHAFNSDGVPIALSSAHGTYRISSARSPGKVNMCSAHRARGQPGEGGLPGLDDGFQRGLLGDAMLGEGMSEFRPRKGMGKTRKKQLSAKSAKYEGGCCSVQ